MWINFRRMKEREQKRERKREFVSYLWTGDGCSVMVFMIRGMNSATSWWTLGLYSWYMSTTMMGSSASTLRDRTPRGMMLYWNLGARWVGQSKNQNECIIADLKSGMEWSIKELQTNPLSRLSRNFEIYEYLRYQE